jgi:uncharacterized membrane protein
MMPGVPLPADLSRDLQRSDNMALKNVLQGGRLGHPLHPAFVHLPIGFWVGSLIFDVLSQAQSDPVYGNFFVIAAWYLVVFGVVAALPTALTGLAEFVDLPQSTRVQRIGLTHMILNVLVTVGYLIQIFVRDTGLVKTTGGILLFNLVLLVVLSYSGYLGGTMAFRYAVGGRRPDNPQIEGKREDLAKKRVA